MFANFAAWRKPRLRRRGCRLVAVKRVGTVSLLLAGSLAAHQARTDTINWLGSVNNLFNVAANWSANRVPTAGDTAFINAATVLVNGITINPDVIDLNNGSVLDLQNSPTLNVASILFGNTGANTSASNIYFEGASGTATVYTLGSGTTLSGRIGGLGNSANINSTPSTLNTAATINANVSGNTTTLGGNGIAVTTFNNTGSITASNGNNLNLNAANFTNSGTLRVTDGTLLLNTSGTVNANTGTLTVDGNGILNLSGNILTNNGTATISNLSSDSGTLTGSGFYTISSVNLSGNSLYFNGASVNAASLNLNNGSTLSIRGKPTSTAATSSSATRARTRAPVTSTLRA